MIFLLLFSSTLTPDDADQAHPLQTVPQKEAATSSTGASTGDAVLYKKGEILAIRNEEGNIDEA